jgi:hypothetical protein
VNFRSRSMYVVLIATSLAFSCNVVKEISQSVMNLSRCKFKLANVSDFRLAGVSLDGKSSLGLVDGAKIAAAFAGDAMPASFTVNVAAINPNDGTGGTSKSAATLTSFAWTLVIDNATTINGDIASPVTIPGTGQESIIPLRMSLDLVKFFKDKGYKQIVNLALALGGANSSPSRLTLRAKPTIKTDFGPIAYPNEIDIIDEEFR